jgi:hypothetical protein
VAVYNRPSRVQVLETFAVFAAVALIASILTKRDFFSLLAMGFLFSALFMKRPAGKITWLWLKLSAILSRINNGIILAILFYLVLTPVALIYRIFNKDPLHLKINNIGSCYTERNHTYSKTDLEKMW